MRGWIWALQDKWLSARILALHLRNAVAAWRVETRLDERMCCDGRECGCYGSTWRSFWKHELSRKPR